MFGDLGKMMKMVGQMKTRLPEVQQQLEDGEYAGQSACGSVRATVNGKFKLRDLEIDPQAMAAGDAEGLEELILEAVAAAQEKAAAAAAKMMQELTGGMTIPGLEGLM